MKFHWGHGIALFLLFFMLFMGFLVVKSINSETHLVTENYYQEELVYQDRIDQMKNAKALAQPVKFNMYGEFLEILFPPEQNRQGVSGTIQLFRPSDPSQDQVIKIDTDTSGLQVLQLKNSKKGYYRCKVKWKSGGKGYYSEETLFLQ